MKDNEKETTIQPLSLDPDKYRQHLEDMDFSKEQENELLQILWNIMSTMVDIGFGEHSVQMVLDSLLKTTSLESADTLKRNNTPINTTHAVSDTAKDQGKPL